MANSTTLTVRLPSRTKQRLGRLAQRTKRTRSFLAGEAIAAFVEHELDVINGIERGLADMKTGRVVTHTEAMARIHKTIRRAATKKPAR